jgi:hypothetical protein
MLLKTQLADFMGKKKFEKKMSTFWAQYTFGGIFPSAFYSFDNFLEPCYQLMLDFFWGMMDNDAKYFNIEVGVP